MITIDDVLGTFQKKFKLKSKKSVCEFLSISPASLSMAIKRNSLGAFVESILHKVELNDFIDLLKEMQQSTIDISVAEKIFDKLNNYFDSSPECLSFSKRLLIVLTNEKIYFLSLLYHALEVDPLESMKPGRLHFDASVHYVFNNLKKLKHIDAKNELQLLQKFFDSLDTEVLIWLLQNKKTVRLIFEASLAKPPLL